MLTDSESWSIDNISEGKYMKSEKRWRPEGRILGDWEGECNGNPGSRYLRKGEWLAVAHKKGESNKWWTEKWVFDLLVSRLLLTLARIGSLGWCG